jgi:hypothetical protein
VHRTRMPHATLVQILVPLEPLGTGAERRAHLKRLADELTAAFGGLTAYVHAPAEGLWEERPVARCRRRSSSTK